MRVLHRLIFGGCRAVRAAPRGGRLSDVSPCFFNGDMGLVTPGSGLGPLPAPGCGPPRRYRSGSLVPTETSLRSQETMAGAANIGFHAGRRWRHAFSVWCAPILVVRGGLLLECARPWTQQMAAQDSQLSAFSGTEEPVRVMPPVRAAEGQSLSR